MKHQQPKALLRPPQSRNRQVRSGISAVRSKLRKNQLQEAAVQLHQLQQLEPSSTEVALMQSELLTKAGDHDRSCQLLKQVLNHHPGLVPALVLFADAHTAAKRYLDALDALERAHQLTPNDYAIARNLAATLARLRRMSDAADILAPVVRKSDSPADATQLAGLYDMAGKLEQSLACYDSIKQNIPDVHVLKAGALLVQGDRANALQSLEQAMKQAPHNASLRLFIAKNFADVFKPAHQVREIDEILNTSGGGKLTREDRARLGFALGLAHERTGNFAEAFSAIEEANRHAAPAAGTDDSQPQEQVALSLSDYFTKTRLAQLAPGGDPSSKPVFVTGPPRSGTTLIEQIIASHPDAGSVGELELIPALKQSLVSLQSQDVRRCAKAWFAAVPESKKELKRIVDKSISTFSHTGLAMLMFPKSSFVFLRRHPMDIYWSAYREMFGTNALTFTYKPHTLVRYIQFSEHVMSLWRQRFPDRILTVRYEDIVSDPEPNIRSIISHLGLDWNDSCLNFHASRSEVRTASMAQVRKPVYKSSVGKWQAYRSQLAPVASALSEQIAEYEKNSE